MTQRGQVLRNIPVVYIAGPYSADPERCTQEAIDVGSRLLDAGIAVIIPHYSHFMHLRHPKPYETWMRVDFALVSVCDGLLRIPGESSGADREVALARELAMPVFTTEAAVIKWFNGGE